MNIYEKYLDIKSREELLKVEKLQCEVDLYNAHLEKFNSKDKGTIHTEADGFKITVVKNEKVEVDQDLASVIQVGFKKEFKYSATLYKELGTEDKKRVDECLTITPAKPTFKVEKL